MTKSILKNKMLKSPLIILNYCGLVSFQHQNPLWIKIKIFLILLPYFIYICMVLSELHLYQVTGMSIDGSNILYYVNILVKVWTLIRYQEQISQILNTIEAYTTTIEFNKNKKENEILNNSVKKCKIMIWCLRINIMTTTTLVVIYYVATCNMFRK